MAIAAVYFHVQRRDGSHLSSLYSGYGNMKVIGNFRKSLSKKSLDTIQQRVRIVGSI